MTPAALRALPKVQLHEHLDGGLREQTLLDLLAARGLRAPAADAPALARWFDERAHAGSLVEYLRGFELTVAAMASPAALERVAFEAAEDARSEGCVLAEFRIAPLLFEPLGVTGDAAVEALLAGLRRGALPCGLIVCAMREQPPAQTLRAVELALRWRDRGVIGFDLAGPERGHPATDHREALVRARAAGLPLTLHAGEADSAQRVAEALALGARRIGHGIALGAAIGRDEALLDTVRHCGAHLEVCPTSNVHTGAAASMAAHPITALWRAGVSLSVHTDNRLMSRVTQSSEFEAVLRETPLTLADLRAMTLAAADASFLPLAQREAATRAIEQGWAAVKS